MFRVYILGVKGSKLIFRNGNAMSLFDPSNIEVNTVGDNMDKWVIYRVEVLQPPFSFLSAESIVQSGNLDFENVSFRDRVFTRGKLVHFMKSFG